MRAPVSRSRPLSGRYLVGNPNDASRRAPTVRVRRRDHRPARGSVHGRRCRNALVPSRHAWPRLRGRRRRMADIRCPARGVGCPSRRGATASRGLPNVRRHSCHGRRLGGQRSRVRGRCCGTAVGTVDHAQASGRRGNFALRATPSESTDHLSARAPLRDPDAVTGRPVGRRLDAIIRSRRFRGSVPRVLRRPEHSLVRTQCHEPDSDRRRPWRAKAACSDIRPTPGTRNYDPGWMGVYVVHRGTGTRSR